MHHVPHQPPHPALIYVTRNVENHRNPLLQRQSRNFLGVLRPHLHVALLISPGVQHLVPFLQPEVLPFSIHDQERELVFEKSLRHHRHGVRLPGIGLTQHHASTSQNVNNRKLHLSLHIEGKRFTTQSSHPSTSMSLNQSLTG